MNHNKLTDLDEISLKVRDKESRLYISEAINAYRGGAYRASIISSWIAVVTDIISKIRELAGQGDANATTQIKDLDTAIQNNNVPQLQKIENELLEKARNDFEFLSQQELTDLERLKEDRNLCAHPAFVTEELLFQPQPEMVRAHIVHAILHLLQHKPVQGKSALTRIKADIIRSSFPGDFESVTKFLGTKYLERAKDSFIKNLVIALLKSYLLNEDADLANKDQSLIYSMGAISHHHPAIYEQTLKEKLINIIDALDDNHLARIFKLIGNDDRHWNLLDEPNQIRIRTLLKNLSIPELVTFEVFDLMDIEDFKDTLTEKFDMLESREKEQIIASIPRPEFSNLAIELYSQSGSYRGAERIGRNIVLPMAKYFTSEQTIKILEAVSENGQINWAGGTPDILVEFLAITKGNLTETKEGWIKFIETLSVEPEEYYSYPDLRKKLVEYGVLSTPYQVSEAVSERVAES